MSDGENVVRSSNPDDTNTIQLMLNGGEVVLRITPEGFFVRGVKVEQGPDEAREVYDAFRAWLRNAGMLA